MARISRRRILGGLGLTALGAGGISFLGCRFTAEERALLDSLERLDVALPDLIDAPRVGHAARAEFGWQVLSLAALSAPTTREALAMPCAVRRGAHLRAAVRSEFGRRETALCDRVVLSRTEIIIAGLRA